MALHAEVFALAAQKGVKRLTITPARNDLSHFSGLAQSHKELRFGFWFRIDFVAARPECRRC